MRFCLCVHCHQPVGNFDHVVSSAWSDSYLPFLETLRRHPGVPAGLHVSGCLTEWLRANRPEGLELIGELCRSGSLELLASGYFEPILPVWRRDDMLLQIDRFCSLMEEVGGSRPRGLWLTERVWEPSLASLAARAGMEYAVVDDFHLLKGGLSPDDLGKPWLTEDSGSVLTLLPGSMRLRYMIPFSPVERIREELRDWHDSGRALAFYGDDGEKFGVWPGTAELCYSRGWLESFFGLLEETDWLELVTPSEAARTEYASGPVYVPASSYPEMGEWTLPAADQLRLDNLKHSLESAGLLEASKDFIRGGMWRNFLSRYPESNELHKRVLGAQEPVYRSGSEEALMHFWRSQCNCAYWHGVFGGIYLPHLREALWRELHSAEVEAHSLLGDLPVVEERDVDADGCSEVLVIGGERSMLIRPGQGLTVSEMSWLPGSGPPVPLGHVLSRRPEAYHTRSPEPGSGGDTGSIHDRMPDPSEELLESIHYDSWRRMSFTDVLLPPGSSQNDWAATGDRAVHFQQGTSRWGISRPDEVTLEIGAVLSQRGFVLDKHLRVDLGEPLTTAVSEYAGTGPGAVRLGMEMALNLLSGDAPERTITLDDGPPVPAGSTGQSFSPVRRILVTDRWRDVAVEILPHQPSDVWYMPIESVSRSEAGYEKVYQGTVLYISVPGTGGVIFGMDVRLGRVETFASG